VLINIIVDLNYANTDKHQTQKHQLKTINRTERLNKPPKFQSGVSRTAYQRKNVATDEHPNMDALPSASLIQRAIRKYKKEQFVKKAKY